MPEPIDYQIVLNLQTALRAIAVADGYHYTVAAAAVKLDPNQSVETLVAPDGLRPFLVLEPLPERWEYQPANQLQMTLPVLIHWLQDSDPTADTSRLQTYLRGCADVERAIAQDITRGGLAVDTRIIKRTPETGVDGALVWAQIETEITICRTYGAPDA